MRTGSTRFENTIRKEVITFRTNTGFKAEGLGKSLSKRMGSALESRLRPERAMLFTIFGKPWKRGLMRLL